MTKSSLDLALGFLVIFKKMCPTGRWGSPRRGRAGGTGGCDGREMGFQKLGHENRRQDSSQRQKAGFT